MSFRLLKINKGRNMLQCYYWRGVGSILINIFLFETKLDIYLSREYNFKAVCNLFSNATFKTCQTVPESGIKINNKFPQQTKLIQKCQINRINVFTKNSNFTAIKTFQTVHTSGTKSYRTAIIIPICSN